MRSGEIIAVRGSGPRRVCLYFLVTLDGVDFGVMVSADGRCSNPPAPLDAILAKGYWRAPNDEEDS